MLLEMCERDPQTGRCLRHDRGGMVKARGTEGLVCCSVYFGQVKSAKSCVGCEGLVPQHETWLVNAECVEALQQGLLVPPRIGSGFRQVFHLAPTEVLPARGAVICEACARQAAAFINAGGPSYGLLKFRDSARHLPFFSSPATRLAAKEQKEQKANNALLEVVETITSGRSIRFSGKNEGMTQCIVHANNPGACVCGGWHNWNDMPSLARRKGGQTQAFAFGPACAEAIRTARPSIVFPNSFKAEMECILAAKKSERQVRTVPTPEPSDSWGGHGVVPVAGERPRQQKLQLAKPITPREAEPETVSQLDQELDDYAGTPVRPKPTPTWQPPDPTKRSALLPPGRVKPKPKPRVRATEGKKPARKTRKVEEPVEESTVKKVSRKERKQKAAAAK